MDSETSSSTEAPDLVGVALAAKALANLEVVQEAVLALCQACKDAAIPIAVKPSVNQ